MLFDLNIFDSIALLECPVRSIIHVTLAIYNNYAITKTVFIHTDFVYPIILKALIFLIITRSMKIKILLRPKCIILYAAYIAMSQFRTLTLKSSVCIENMFFLHQLLQPTQASHGKTCYLESCFTMSSLFYILSLICFL